MTVARMTVARMTVARAATVCTTTTTAYCVDGKKGVLLHASSVYNITKQLHVVEDTGK